jgi:3-deoxy-D-manno-octulosonic-acid transferase
METELWPRFFRECRRAGVPVALVNGRISEKSFARYKLIRPFIRRVLADLSLAAAQSEADAERLVQLGLPRERAHVTGNVKFDIEEAAADPLTEEMRRRFRLSGDRPLVIAASTHAPEERVVLEAFRLTAGAEAEKPGAGGGARPRLLIAPRHRERFAEVAALIEASGLSWARRSDAPRYGDAECDVILLDSIGELLAVYPLAEVVFVGGSIAPVGGHNVLEPALSARAVVTGAHTSNFKSVVASLLEQEALVQLPHADDAEAPRVLARALRDLLGDEAKRRRTGERARAVLEQNRGATARTLELLAPLLGQRSEAGGQWPVEETTLTTGP